MEYSIAMKISTLLPHAEAYINLANIMLSGTKNKRIHKIPFVKCLGNINQWCYKSGYGLPLGKIESVIICLRKWETFRVLVSSIYLCGNYTNKFTLQ